MHLSRYEYQRKIIKHAIETRVDNHYVLTSLYWSHVNCEQKSNLTNYFLGHEIDI